MEHAKKNMTEEERLALAAKLDKDLDDFINNLPKRETQTGLPIDDDWIEEVQNHPFFMKNLPEPGQKLHPLYEGLQKLKYDPEENEPLELAIAYKDDGNFNFKHKNYRLAILSYTEGIKVKCGDAEVEASLYNNRAAANFFLKNYRSSLRDCELALKLKPDYPKTMIRAANCCFQMKRYVDAVQYCDKILDTAKDTVEILELRKKCVNASKLIERNKRKREIDQKKMEQEGERLANEIIGRGINIEGGKGGITLDKLEPCVPQLSQNRVYIDLENKLVWPVILLYPEYTIMDYIQEFKETDTFIEHLSQVFENPPEWDEKQKYKVKDLVLYFESRQKKLLKVDVATTLGDVLKMKGYVVKGGTPSFLVFVKNSAAHKRFLDNY